MATGNFQPIVPYDLEAFRVGTPPLEKEAASVTAVRGALAVFSAGFIAEAATTPTAIYGILAEPGHNASGTGTNIMVWRVTPSVLFEITLNEAYTQSLAGTAVGMVKDGTTSIWYGSTANAGGQFVILGQVPTWSVNDTKSRVIGFFLPQFLQPYTGASNTLSGGMGANLASAATITPTNAVHHVTGVTTVNTITAPAGISSGTALNLIADGANLQIGTAGNVNDRVDLIAGQAVRFIYDTGTSKWYPEKLPTSAPVVIAASGAIAPSIPATYVITKAGVAAMTLAAPTVTTDDGVVLVITSNTANAHTITATGLLQTGSASVNVATFAANAGASVTLIAYQGKWNALAQIGITFS